MKYEIYLFGLRFSLNPIAFTLPIGSGWNIYWYGIIIAAGFLTAIIYAMRNAGRFNIETDRMLDVALVTTPLAILSARTYYLIFDGEKIGSVGDFFGFDSSGFSGLAIYGGVIGAFLVGAVMCKIRKIKILDMFDISAIGFIIGQGIGRWGNFTNQEAYGGFTGSSWWGMESTRTIAEMGKGLVHPCFLYESIWCISGAFLLHYLSKKRRFSGEIALAYGVWYGFGRAVIELLRTDSLMIGRFKASFLLSLILCIACAVIIFVKLSKIRENAGEYVPIYAGSDLEESDVATTSENEVQTEESAAFVEESIDDSAGN